MARLLQSVKYVLCARLFESAAAALAEAEAVAEAEATSAAAAVKMNTHNWTEAVITYFGCFKENANVRSFGGAFSLFTDTLTNLAVYKLKTR